MRNHLSPDLARLTAAGYAWSVGARLTSHGLQVVATVILAHLLYPNDFGVLAIALLFTTLVTAITDVGFASLIVRRPRLDEPFLSTLFWLSLGTHVGLMLTVYAIAPWLGTFFEHPMVQPILRYLAPTVLLSALAGPYRGLLSRDLRFATLAVIEVTTIACFVAVSITLALRGEGVWALAWGILGSRMLSTILLWCTHSWRSRLVFSRQDAREVRRASSQLIASQLLSYGGANVDYLIVGKFLGLAALGWYTLAYELAMSLQSKLLPALTRIAFPVFARLQHDPPRARQWYLKTLRDVSFVACPLLLALLVLAPELIRTVFGSRWLPSIPVLQVLCLGGLAAFVGPVLGAMLLAQGRFDLLLKVMLIRLFGTTSCALLGIPFGITGVAAGITAYLLASVGVLHWLSRDVTGVSLQAYGHTLSHAAVASTAMAAVLLGYRAIQRQIGAIPDLPFLGASALLGTLVYLGVLKLCGVNLFRQLGPFSTHG